MNTTVGLQLCDTYDFEKVYACIVKLFELVPPPDFKGKTVLLKPNILYPKKPELAVCTHPIVVGAVVKAFVEGGAARVIVGESPALANPTTAAKAVGLYDQVINNGGQWVEFKDITSIDCPDGVIVKRFDFATQITEADLVVSVAKLKTHQFMTYTGAMKNLFGLMIGLEKARTHYRFPKKEDFGNFLTDLILQQSLAMQLWMPLLEWKVLEVLAVEIQNNWAFWLLLTTFLHWTGNVPLWLATILIQSSILNRP